MDKKFKVGALAIGVILLTSGCDNNFFETREQKLDREIAEDLRELGFESKEQYLEYMERHKKNLVKRKMEGK